MLPGFSKLGTRGRQFPDWSLAIAGLPICGLAYRAYSTFPQLAIGWKLVGLTSLFLSPMLLLYGFWRCFRPGGNPYVALMALFGALGTGLWISTILSHLLRLAS